MKQSTFGIEGVVTGHISVPTRQGTLKRYFKELGMSLECFKKIPKVDINQKILWEYN